MLARFVSAGGQQQKVDETLELLRQLPAATTPLSWESEDSVAVHSAINGMENNRLPSMKRSTSLPSLTGLVKIVKKLQSGKVPFQVHKNADKASGLKRSVSFSDTPSLMTQHEAHNGSSGIASEVRTSAVRVRSTNENNFAGIELSDDSDSDDNMEEMMKYVAKWEPVKQEQASTDQTAVSEVRTQHSLRLSSSDDYMASTCAECAESSLSGPPTALNSSKPHAHLTCYGNIG